MEKPHGHTRRILRPDLKRRRPPLACIQCYSRKIKCSRESPACGRCIRAGKGHECAYRNEPSDDHPPAQSRPSPRPLVTGPTHDGATSPKHTRYLAPRSVEGRMAHLKGPETSTKFYGFSYPLNLYQQFPELRCYIAKVKNQHPAINQLRDEIYGTTTSLGPRQQQCPSQLRIVENFETLVPTRTVADMLVQTYMDRFEVIHRVVHTPTFMGDYCGYWNKTRLVSATFLAQLLLMMASASSLHPETAFNGGTDMNPSRRCILRWIEAVDSWLIPLAFEPAPDSTSTLTTHCLLILAKRANSVHESTLWSSTGSLVRRAMAAGYHREVDSATDVSPFNREMRRRLWATVTELDLQASIDRGMTPSIRPGDFNTNVPLNVEDEAIQDSTEEMFAPLPLDTWTTTSCQVLLYQSFMARLEVCCLVNGSQDRDMFDEALQLSDKLARALQEIPAWRGTGHSLQDLQTITYVRGVVSIVLNLFLVVLHVPMAIKTPPTWKVHVSRRARLDAALGILIHHRRLVDDGIVPDCACRPGLVLGALNLCHELYLSWNTSSGGSPSPALTSPEIALAHLMVVERALQLLHGPVATTLEGLNEYYVLAMVIGLIKSKICPQLTTSAEQDAAQQVIHLCEKVKSALPTLCVDDAEDTSAFRRTQPGQCNQGIASPGLSDRVDCFLPMFPDDLGFLHSDFLLEDAHTGFNMVL
ncbi:hypothetical protein LTS17_009609 [Exophiala oligosperma]